MKRINYSLNLSHTLSTHVESGGCPGRLLSLGGFQGRPGGNNRRSLCHPPTSLPGLTGRESCSCRFGQGWGHLKGRTRGPVGRLDLASQGQWTAFQAKCLMISLSLYSFYRVNEVQRFEYSRPIRKGEKNPDNEFAVKTAPATWPGLLRERPCWAGAGAGGHVGTRRQAASAGGPLGD